MASSTLQRPRAARGLSRGGYALLGLTCVGLGFVGIAIPGMPSTIFFIIALWAFQRSSERLERWLLSNRLVGRTLRDWHETRSLTLRTKIVAVTAIWLCIGVSIALTSSPVLWAILGVTAAALTFFLATRRTKPA